MPEPQIFQPVKVGSTDWLGQDAERLLRAVEEIADEISIPYSCAAEYFEKRKDLIEKKLLPILTRNFCPNVVLSDGGQEAKPEE